MGKLPLFGGKLLDGAAGSGQMATLKAKAWDEGMLLSSGRCDRYQGSQSEPFDMDLVLLM